ncbi:MAG: ABC transporter substrate-binding protein, partial [Blastocatellia bacterium]
EATEQLVEKDNVFALVGSFEPGGGNTTNDYLEKKEVPLIGPVTLSPLLRVPPNPFVFYLMPSFGSQARVLVDFLAAMRSKAKYTVSLKLAVVYEKNDYDEDARIGIEQQANGRHIEVVVERTYEAGAFDPQKLASAVGSQNPDYVFFFGPASDIVKFGDALRDQKVSGGLMTSLVLLGRSVFDLPPEIAKRTYMAYPAAYPQQEDMSDFDNLVKKSSLTLRHSAFQRAAYGAARVLLGALEEAGRRISRKELVESLDQMREFQTGVLPPVTFGPNRRVGCEGSYVVGIDPDKKQIVPLSGWLAPSDLLSAHSGSPF